LFHRWYGAFSRSILICNYYSFDLFILHPVNFFEPSSSRVIRDDLHLMMRTVPKIQDILNCHTFSVDVDALSLHLILSAPQWFHMILKTPISWKFNTATLFGSPLTIRLCSSLHHFPLLPLSRQLRDFLDLIASLDVNEREIEPTNFTVPFISLRLLCWIFPALDWFTFRSNWPGKILTVQ
jgi:hypothetical protein